MSENLMANYVWLINTIDSGEFTLTDITKKWDARNPNRPLSARTFHRWRDAIKEVFGYEIKCKKRGTEHFYFINRKSEVQRERTDSASEFVVSSLSFSNVIAESGEVHDKIILESIPKGYQYLQSIIDGIRQQAVLNITHKKFVSTEPEQYSLHPCGLKVHKQRWYLLAYVPKRRGMRVFALDRIVDLKVSRTKFEMTPKHIHVMEYFADCYGVFHIHEAEKIVIQTYGEMPEYLRTLPLHCSQKEIGDGRFEFFLRPEQDFINELLSHGEQLEVIEPESLRNTMRQQIGKMYQRYNNNED